MLLDDPIVRGIILSHAQVTQADLALRPANADPMPFHQCECWLLAGFDGLSRRRVVVEDIGYRLLSSAIVVPFAPHQQGLLAELIFRRLSLISNCG